MCEHRRRREQEANEAEEAEARYVREAMAYNAQKRGK